MRGEPHHFHTLMRAACRGVACAAVALWLAAPPTAMAGPRGTPDEGLFGSHAENITIFTEQWPGRAAAPASIGQPLKLAIMKAPTPLERLTQASVLASRAACRLIVFEAGRVGAEVTPASAPVLADAATATSEAILRMSQRSDLRGQLDRILKVQLIVGSPAAVDLTTDGVLLVTVELPRGQRGLPSFEQVSHQVGQAFH